MKNKNQTGPHFISLRQFSWSGNKKKSESEELIENTVIEWYNAKHPKQSEQEIRFINSIKIYDCPYCNGPVMKNGHRKDGIQKYKCSSCKREFNTLTGTIFDNHKIPLSEWIEYLTHLFEFHSIKTSANDNRNSDTTGRFWLKKVFAVLEGIQNNIVLEGNVYLDETFLPVIENKKKKINDKELRGLSKNLLNIGTAIDDKNCLLIYEKRSKPTDSSTLKAFAKHIKEESTLIHDGEKSHNALIDKLCLKSKVYTSANTKKLNDAVNPLAPINNFHKIFKRFMKSHGGYERSNIQDWLNLFWFIYSLPLDKNDKIKIFIERAVKIRKIVRYRENMKKK